MSSKVLRALVILVLLLAVLGCGVCGALFLGVVGWEALTRPELHDGYRSAVLTVAGVGLAIGAGAALLLRKLLRRKAP